MENTTCVIGKLINENVKTSRKRNLLMTKAKLNNVRYLKAPGSNKKYIPAMGYPMV